MCRCTGTASLAAGGRLVGWLRRRRWRRWSRRNDASSRRGPPLVGGRGPIRRCPHVSNPSEPTLLRIALPDQRGLLALIASRLAAAGIDILRVEVVSADGKTAIDDLLVRGPDPERVFDDLHPAVQLLASRQRGVLPDPGLAMAEACASFAHARSLPAARQRYLTAALELVGAERGALLWHAGRGWL